MSETLPKGMPAGEVAHPQRLGAYRVEALLGEGGMGRVYRALDEALNRSVAVKTLLPTLAADPEFVARFKREAQSAAALNHPNITQVYTIGQEGSIPFFAMELIRGRSLDTLIKQQGALDAQLAASYILQAAEGLRHAAGKNLIHRDIKPSNLMLTEEGIVKITDFGLAKVARSDTQLTATGEVLGSPGYISPEQAQGGTLDLRSDIYSLGATFYHLVIGKTPFAATTAVAMIIKHMNEPLRPPCAVNTAVPFKLSAAIQKMMAKRPQDRFQDYDALIEELHKSVSSTQPLGASRGAPPPDGGQPRPATVPGNPGTRPHTRRMPAVPAAEEPARSISWLPIALVLTIGIAAVAAISQQWRGDDARAAAASTAPEQAPPRSDRASVSSVQSDGRFVGGPAAGGTGRREARETLRERLGQRAQARARADLVIVETDHDILPNGDLEVTGRVKNNGTVAASQVRVRVRIIGNDGLVATQSESELQPETLAPGASAPFTTYFQYDGPVGTISTEIVWSQ
jgi:serine/threonine-protein kinase